MDTPALAAPPVDPTLSATPPTAAELAKRANVTKTAGDFEASFLTVMLNAMFKDVGSTPPFGGGAGEEMWKSFLGEAMAGQMVKAGGIGVSKAVAREMLRLQGLQGD